MFAGNFLAFISFKILSILYINLEKLYLSLKNYCLYLQLIKKQQYECMYVNENNSNLSDRLPQHLYYVVLLDLQTKYDVYEKSLYGALSGNLRAMLPVCKSWSDHVWAHYKVLVDIRAETEIRTMCAVDKSLDIPQEYWDQPYVIFIEVYIRMSITLKPITVC